MFDYAEMTTRNIGFVTQAEQEKLRRACVFVCGTGGMGGAALLALARAGIGKVVIADIDTFEVSNLNRQVFCTLDTVDQHKADATRDQLLKINPELVVEVYHDDWPETVAQSVASADVVINGADDLGASLLLYRTAKTTGKPVIDAYASPFPSVYVTKPSDTAHEERLGYPTVGTDWDKLSEEQRSTAFLRESEHIVIHSSSRHHIDLDMVGEVVSGRRSRMSFAPMVITTGQLMAYETIHLILGRPYGADNRGWFFNPYKARIEHPKPAWLAALMRPFVRRFLNRLAGSV